MLYDFLWRSRPCYRRRRVLRVYSCVPVFCFFHNYSIIFVDFIQKSYDGGQTYTNTQLMLSSCATGKVLCLRCIYPRHVYMSRIYYHINIPI